MYPIIIKITCPCHKNGVVIRHNSDRGGSMDLTKFYKMESTYHQLAVAPHSWHGNYEEGNLQLPTKPSSPVGGQ